MEAVTSFFKATKAAVLNIPEMEQKVLDATNNQKWGPTGPEMKEISAASHRYTDFPLIMKTIWNRLSERNSAEWRQVYKSLLLLDYMIKNGSYQVVTDAQAHVHVLHSLADYSAYEGGDDKGISVRERARVVVELLSDKRRLEEERDKAAANRQKFQASMSSESGGGRYSGGGYSSGGYDGYSDRDTYSGSGYGDSHSQRRSDSYDPYSSPEPQKNYENTSSYSTPGYSDSRPGVTRAAPVQASPQTTAKYDRYDSSSYLTDSDEDEDEIPASVTAAAERATRPRAPSGGATTMPPPSQSVAKQSSPAVDLLGLDSGPSNSSSVGGFGDFTSSANSQQATGNFWGDFSSSTGSQPAQQMTQQQMQQMQQQQMQQQMTQQQMQQLQQQQMMQQQQMQQHQMQQGEVQGQKTLNGQIRKASAPVSSKPKLSEADSKDPWKKGGNLFSLDALGGSKPKTSTATPSGGQKIPLNSMPQTTAQYSNLHMLNSGNMGNTNPNMRNANMGGNMGNPNMMGGNPNMMGGNPNMMGGNPNMMGSNMGNRPNPNMMGGNMGMSGGMYNPNSNWM